MRILRGNKIEGPLLRRKKNRMQEGERPRKGEKGRGKKRESLAKGEL